ncbi:hypothetical protein BU24DRAFT_399134 [Aaosphaeria arxii CBS 175.79]|uniref:Uncharacterized protein n=1 Tax=Aaosphaeria arxii CBS 175.79 TaxID=1450172 RepID=A0A6A5XDM8_9PLEO|nr:uncharacterized protein BU24DRAFT_399134 [Aaosphaeria arxii CBS 175.79]KAF2010999.1 hypothetical protein BU24DRAFT_399134 [Aaosphaeria arxii CBS 175.79]
MSSSDNTANKQHNEQQGDHIPTTNESQPEEQQSTSSGGLLSSVGDPLGKALNKGLRPIGYPLEKGVTGPLGNALGGTTRGALGPLMGEQHERMEVLGGDNKDSYESTPEKIAGKEQTGDNPLGLDQSGRWGFRDE